MKLLYRILLLLCLLLPGRSFMGTGHAAGHQAGVSRFSGAGDEMPAGPQFHIQQLVIKSGAPGATGESKEPRAAIAEDEDSGEDDNDDERSTVSDRAPAALLAFSFLFPAAACSAERFACRPAHSRPFLCPVMGRRLALLSAYRI